MADSIERIADEMAAMVADAKRAIETAETLARHMPSGEEHSRVMEQIAIGRTRATIIDQWATRLRALSPAGGDWVMVPREPTWPMLCALHHGRNEPVADEQEKIASRYAAMLAASPQQEPGAVLTEAEQASIDAAIYGTGFMVGGKRVAPEHVYIATPASPAAGKSGGIAESLEFMLDGNSRYVTMTAEFVREIAGTLRAMTPITAQVEGLRDRLIRCRPAVKQMARAAARDVDKLGVGALPAHYAPALSAEEKRWDEMLAFIDAIAAAPQPQDSMQVIECGGCAPPVIATPAHGDGDGATINSQSVDSKSIADPSGQTLAVAGGPLLKVLADLLDHVDRETCTHEEVHRGGAIWTICDSCGRKWADDEGGFVQHEDAPAVAAARAALTATSAGTTGDDSEDAARYRNAIVEHNANYGECDKKKCGYAPYKYRECPECPAQHKIDLAPLDTARRAREVGNG